MTVRPWNVLNKNNHTTQDVADERLAICKECPFFLEKPQVCKKCGCFMVAKTKLKKAKCPVGKW